MTTPHSWRFERIGGFDQVVVETADDLRNLHTLDQKLWVALACPVRGNELDETTLALVDSDKDGRIRAPELLAAIAWMDEGLVDLGAIVASQDGLALDNIANPTMAASARRILEGRGKTDATQITVADTSAASAVLNAMPFNGDGVVPASATQDAALAGVIHDIITTTSGITDRNGEKGVNATLLDTFWKALEDYSAWWKQAEDAEDTVVPLGEDTAPAVEAFAAVRPKIDDYFTRCDLAAFDARATAHLARAEGHWSDLAERTLSPSDADIKAFPLSAIVAGRDLPLQEGINPAWREAFDVFVRRAVTPLLGEQTRLNRDQWAELKSRFAAYEAWLAGKTGGSVEPLGIERIRALLASDHRAAIEALIAEDEARKPEADALFDVDRATRFHRDLYTLVNNFVSFQAFYDPEQHAMFQAGTLFLDGRSCDLVVRVDDIAKHSATAPQSYVYLAYCVCTREGSKDTMSIAAAFTNGDADFLAVGRNGVLYDRQGRDWDATITKVVEQPISIRQAFWTPYKRLAAFISDQAEAFTSAQDTAASSNLSAEASANAAKLKAATQTPPAGGPLAAAPSTSSSAFDIGKFAGIFAAVGLAVGFLASAATMLVTGLLSLRPWQIPLALGAVLLLISGPSMLLAAFKLARRNLAPMLDASGWAINTRARINIPFGASLTQVAQLPEGSQRELRDPYGERRSPWRLYAFLLIVVFGAVVLWDLGISEWFPPMFAAESTEAAAQDSVEAAPDKVAPAPPVAAPSTP